MAETPNLHLTKDATTDYYSVERVNANSDRIDAFAGQTAGSIAGLGTRAAALEASQAAQDSAIAAIGQKVWTKNLFDYEKWKEVGVARGTQTHTSDGAMTITCTSGTDCFTGYGMSGTITYPADAVIPVTAGKKYIFSLSVDSISSGGKARAMVFRNGQTTGADIIGNTGEITAEGVQSVTFTAPAGCTFVTFRLDVIGLNQSAAFSDIMFRDDGTDGAFQPYAPSNRALYEMILALQGGTS